MHCDLFQQRDARMMIEEEGFSIDAPAPGQLTLTGELDLAARAALETAVQAALDRGGPLTMDLTAVSYLDSSAIYVLFLAADGLRRQGERLTVAIREGSFTRRVLELVDLERVADIELR